MDSSRTFPADLSRELLDDLLAYKALFEGVAEIVGDGVVHLDERCRIVRFNAAAERLLGFSKSGVIGTPFEDLYHASNPGDPFDGTAQANPVRMVLRDTVGEAVPVLARAAALKRGDTVEGWLLAFAANRRVDEIEQLKNELVSTVSHELKTPLAAIKAYTATLRHNPALYESHRDEFLAVVEQQADRLSRLVDDMLLVTRVETAQLLKRRTVVALDGVLERALGDLSYDPAAHPIELRTSGVSVSGDPDRLRDIFRNLLENAVKYSPAGGAVTVSAAQTAETTTVEVRDNGIGIPEDHLPYIFDRFYRVESGAAAEAGGSGLGLYIVHALVRAHGGAIDVRSEPGKGTSFFVRLPLR